jgi:hypothetical protein
MSNKSDSIFKIRFYQDDHIYEIYARSLAQEAMFGFLEVEELVFAEGDSVIVNPEEERLRAEFKDVICTYIPMHAVLRIDEVKVEGVAKAIPTPKDANNIVRPFPSHLYKNNKPQE